MKKYLPVISAFFALIFVFFFGVRISASFDAFPAEIDKNESFLIKINENVSYNAYKATYFYYDFDNSKGYSYYEYKLLGEDYINKDLVFESYKISSLEVDDNLDSSFSKSGQYYYVKVDLIKRSYSYWGNKVDTVVKTLISDEIKVERLVIDAPYLVSPSNGAVLNSNEVNFVVNSKFEYKIYISEDNVIWNAVDPSFKYQDTKTYYWKAINSEGTNSEVFSFLIDLNPNLPNFLINGSVTGWNNKNVSISLKTADKGTTFYCLNGECNNILSSKSIVIEEEGIHEFYVKVVYNNQTYTSDKSMIKIDKTVPEIDDSNYEFSYFIKSNAYQYDYRLVLKDINDLSSIREGNITIKENNNVIFASNYSSNEFDLSSYLKEKTTYKLVISLTDYASNSVSKEFSIVTPANPSKPMPIPADIKTEGTIGSYTNENVVVKVTLNDANLQSSKDYYCVNDNCSLITSNMTYVYDKDGTYTIYTKRDLENNSSSSNKIVVMIDKTAPIVDSNSYSFDYFISNNPYQYDYLLKVNLNESSLKEVSISIKQNSNLIFNSSYEKTNFSVDLSSYLEESTSYVLYLSVEDSAGNVNTKEFALLTPKNPEKPVVKAPSLSINGVTGKYTNKNVYVNVSLDSNYKESSKDYYCINQSCTLISSNQKLTFDKEGSYSLYTKRELNGESDISNIINVLIDKTDPVINDSNINFSENLNSNNTYEYQLNISLIDDVSGINQVDVNITSSNISIFKKTITKLSSSFDLTNVLAANKTYVLEIVVLDNAGNSSSYSTNINTSALPVSDPVLPTVNFTGIVGSYTNQNVVASITLDKSTLNEAKNYYCVNESCTLLSKDGSVTFSTDGVYNFYVKSIIDSKEVTGNKYVIKIDKTAPVIGQISIDESASNTTENAQGYLINLSDINDINEIVSVKVEIYNISNSVVFANSYSSISTSLSIVENTISNAGSYTLKVLIKDSLGNEKTYSKSMSIRAPGIYAPLIKVEGDISSTWTKDKVKITFTAHPDNPKDVKNYYCYKFAFCYLFDKEFTYEYEDGIYNNITSFVEYGSLTVESTEVYSFKMDTIAPVMKSVSGPINKWLMPIYSPMINIYEEDYEEVGSGIDKFYTFNDELYPNGTNETALRLGGNLKTGIYHFRTYVVDKAGNKSNEVEYDVMIDGDTPVIDSNYYVFSTSTVNGESKYELKIQNVSDEHSGFSEVYVAILNSSKNVISEYQNTTDISFPFSIDLTSLADGTYYFYLYAKDNVGNYIYSNQVKFVKGGTNSTFVYSGNLTDNHLIHSSDSSLSLKSFAIVFMSLISLVIFALFLVKKLLVKKLY